MILTVWATRCFVKKCSSCEFKITLVFASPQKRDKLFCRNKKKREVDFSKIFIIVVTQRRSVIILQNRQQITRILILCHSKSLPVTRTGLTQDLNNKIPNQVRNDIIGMTHLTAVMLNWFQHLNPPIKNLTPYSKSINIYANIQKYFWLFDQYWVYPQDKIVINNWLILY